MRRLSQKLKKLADESSREFYQLKLKLFIDDAIYAAEHGGYNHSEAFNSEREAQQFAKDLQKRTDLKIKVVGKQVTADWN